MTTDKMTVKTASGLQITVDSPFGRTPQTIPERKNSATYVNAITTSPTNADLKTNNRTQEITTMAITTVTTETDNTKVETDTTKDTTKPNNKYETTSDSTERETQELSKLEKEIEINKNNIKNQKQASKNYKKQKNTNEMKIACLNVRGLNKKQKQNQIKKYIENEKWDVTILNETKIKENQGNFIFKGWENYDTINSSYNDENNKNGIMIVLKGNLS